MCVCVCVRACDCIHNPMCLTFVKRAVVCTDACVMLIEGAPPLFEAIVIFSSVSKGQRPLARRKRKTQD